MTDHAFSGRPAPSAPACLTFAAPGLLMLTGGLLAVTIIISGLAANAGAPVLWFLTLVMAGSGLILLALAHLAGQIRGAWRPRLVYSLGAGAFMAGPSAIGYLSVSHVGAGYISITFAFPVLLTYLMALGAGMARFSARRCLGVCAALFAGLALALSKATQTGMDGGGTGWVLLASSIPVLIALGNLYRTRFWPAGSSPLLLAALMLILGALLLAPFAALREGTDLARPWSDPALCRLAAIDIGIFCIQYVAYFRLQHVAGPVYLSQLGSVAAITGSCIAALLGETLPPVLPFAILGLALGLILFHRSATA